MLLFQNPDPGLLFTTIFYRFVVSCNKEGILCSLKVKTSNNKDRDRIQMKGNRKVLIDKWKKVRREMISRDYDKEGRHVPHSVVHWTTN